MISAGNLRRRCGRRGAFLLLYGAGEIQYGIGLIAEPPVDQRALALPVELFPLRWWGLLWIACGLIGIAHAAAASSRDKPGFIAQLLPPHIWALSNLASWWPLGTYPRGWASAASVLIVAGGLMIASGWVEPQQRRRP